MGTGRAQGATALRRNPPRRLERPTGFEPATSSLGSWHSATELRPPVLPYSSLRQWPVNRKLHSCIRSARLRLRLAVLLERHVVGLDQLVAARLPDEPLGRSVQVHLLVERHRRHLLDPQLVDPVIRGQPLLLVHLRL